MIMNLALCFCVCPLCAFPGLCCVILLFCALKAIARMPFVGLFSGFFFGGVFLHKYTTFFNYIVLHGIVTVLDPPAPFENVIVTVAVHVPGLVVR